MFTYMQSLSFLIALVILIQIRFVQTAIALPVLETERNNEIAFYTPYTQTREKSLIATAGGVFGYNPYFCDSFALASLNYLPSLPTAPHSATPLVELKYLIANADEYAISFGGGVRNYFSLLRSVIGSNIFCDIKHVSYETFYQLAAGLECLSFLELRANVYIPITKRFVIKATYDYPGGYQVKGKNIISGFSGWNIEVGKRFAYKTLCDLYFSIAPYFLFGKGYGIEYDGLFRWRSILFAGVQIYQKIYCDTTEIAGTIGINIPLDSIGADEKGSLKRIPISRWETIRTNSRLKYKTNY